MSALNWTLLVNTTITTIGVIFSTFGVAVVLKRTKTPSGPPLGQQITEVHELTTGHVVEQLDRIEKNGGEKGRDG